MTQAVSTVHEVARAIHSTMEIDAGPSVRPSVSLNDRTCEQETIISTIVRSYFVAKTLVSMRPLLLTTFGCGV